jgi:hypothetical protein
MSEGPDEPEIIFEFDVPGPQHNESITTVEELVTAFHTKDRDYVSIVMGDIARRYGDDIAGVWSVAGQLARALDGLSMMFAAIVVDDDDRRDVAAEVLRELFLAMRQ